MSREITLQIGGSAAELARITAAVEDLAETEGWPAELVFQTTLVLEELEVNIMNYAYGDDESVQSQITLRSEPDRLTIEISDSGTAFNPLEDAREPDLDAALEDRRIGGLGIHFVRTLMDEVSYRREDGRNHLTLVKRRD